MAGGDAPAPAKPVAKAVTVPALHAMRAAGEKIAMLTCYDASFAALMDRCGVDMLLVGDSLGMVLPGPPVDAAGDAGRHGLPHGLRRARQQAARWLVADMPFGSYGDAGTGLRQRRRADAGRRPHGQARRRRLAGRHRALPDRARHPGLRPPRPDAAIGAPAGRLQGAGQDRSQAPTQLKADALALQAAGAAHAGAGSDARPRWAEKSPSCWPCRPSASAPARTARARCW